MLCNMKFLPFIIFYFVLSCRLFAQHEQHQPSEKTIYTCPMHPEVQKTEAGKCPKCGMNLVPENRQPQQAKPESKKFFIDTLITFTDKVNMQPGKTVRYDLYVTDTMVNYTGKWKHAYAINGRLPGPDLVFTEGDTAAVYVHNLSQHETSIHWHGVILPNQFDGVPYLTTQPIHSGKTHLYKFAVQQNGTYWYHSHSGLQEQIGVYGALIFKKRATQQHVPFPVTEENNELHAVHYMNDTAMNMHYSPITNLSKTGNVSYNAEQTVVLSEWSDEKPQQTLRRLRMANDWYAIKKGSVQSYWEAIQKKHFTTKLTNEWKRMKAMDVSDVYYDKFLINGKPEMHASQFKKGDKIRLRIVNAGGSSYFWVQYAGGKMTVIANDGNDVTPVEVNRLIIGVSETYDVVVNIPDTMSYEVRVTPEDRTQAASLWLGSGMPMPAPHLPRLKYFEGMKMMNSMMKMDGNMKPMNMSMSLQQMDMNSVMYEELNTTKYASQTNSHHAQHNGSEETTRSNIVTLNYAMLQSPYKTQLPNAPYKTLRFELTGNMNRYVWSINNKVVREWDKILIEKGQNVRIILFNNSMMRHPMHLHGHDFRVVNGQGEYAPLKNVLDIMPIETDTIEFAGSQDGDWFFHCHILYHMMAGMGNVFSYKNSLPNPELPDKTAAYNKFIRSEQMLHFMAEVGLETNGSDGKAMLADERYEWRTEWRLGFEEKHGMEIETYLGRYLGKMQWWYPFIGFDYHHNSMENDEQKNVFGQWSNQNNRKAFVAGVEYLLPFLIRAQARIDSKGKFRFQVGREGIPLTPRLRLNAMWNTDKEYMTGLQYIVRKWFTISTHYDSDMHFGAGITIVY